MLLRISRVGAICDKDNHKFVAIDLKIVVQAQGHEELVLISLKETLIFSEAFTSELPRLDPLPSLPDAWAHAVLRRPTALTVTKDFKALEAGPCGPSWPRSASPPNGNFSSASIAAHHALHSAWMQRYGPDILRINIC